MTLRKKRRLAILLLCAGLPAYVIAAVTVAGSFGRPSPLLELAFYAAAGILWALPFKGLFRGITASEASGDNDRGGTG